LHESLPGQRALVHLDQNPTEWLPFDRDVEEALRRRRCERWTGRDKDLGEQKRAELRAPSQLKLCRVLFVWRIDPPR
jgi:hypothetical protein